LGGYTVVLSIEVTKSGKVLGKAVGQEVLSFQRRDAPLEISPRMHQQVQMWHSGKHDRDQSGEGPSGWQAQKRARSGKSAAEIMQQQTKRNAAWGREPVGEWTDTETKAWEKEQQASKETSEMWMRECRKRSRSSRGTRLQCPRRPNKRLVARLAAQVVAYRMESRKTAKDSAAGILYDKKISTAVRSMVGDYEAMHKHSGSGSSSRRK
jgi:hypothetical protein